MVLKCILRPVGEYRLSITPDIFPEPLQNIQNDGLWWLHYISLPMVRSFHDTIKDGSSKKCDGSLRSAGVRDSCFSVVARLEMYKHYLH
jgi:hypothetical protein